MLTGIIIIGIIKINEVFNLIYKLYNFSLSFFSNKYFNRPIIISLPKKSIIVTPI